MSKIYMEKGFTNRREYLKDLAQTYDIDIEIVLIMADTLGPSEDFDGLISTLKDAEGMKNS